MARQTRNVTVATLQQTAQELDRYRSQRDAFLNKIELELSGQVDTRGHASLADWLRLHRGKHRGLRRELLRLDDLILDRELRLKRMLSIRSSQISGLGRLMHSVPTPGINRGTGRRRHTSGT